MLLWSLGDVSVNVVGEGFWFLFGFGDFCSIYKLLKEFIYKSFGLVFVLGDGRLIVWLIY